MDFYILMDFLKYFHGFLYFNGFFYILMVFLIFSSLVLSLNITTIIFLIFHYYYNNTTPPVKYFLNPYEHLYKLWCVFAIKALIAKVPISTHVFRLQNASICIIKFLFIFYYLLEVHFFGHLQSQIICCCLLHSVLLGRNIQKNPLSFQRVTSWLINLSYTTLFFSLSLHTLPNIEL